MERTFGHEIQEKISCYDSVGKMNGFVDIQKDHFQLLLTWHSVYKIGKNVGAIAYFSESKLKVRRQQI